MCPSGAVFTIPLGPTNPWLIVIAKETLIFRRAGFSPAFVVTCANILTSKRSRVAHAFSFTADWNTLLPLVDFIEEANKIVCQKKVATLHGFEP